MCEYQHPFNCDVDEDAPITLCNNNCGKSFCPKHRIRCAVCNLSYCFRYEQYCPSKDAKSSSCCWFEVSCISEGACAICEEQICQFCVGQVDGCDLTCDLRVCSKCLADPAVAEQAFIMCDCSALRDEISCLRAAVNSAKY